MKNSKKTAQDRKNGETQKFAVIATKQKSTNLNDKSDKMACNITGIAMTPDGKILMVDEGNEKVKMFTQDLVLCSSVSVPGAWDIGVVSESEAAVGGENSLVFLDISNGQMQVKKQIELQDQIYGINNFHDKLLVTFPATFPASIKLIDQTAKPYWALPTDQEQESLFESPWYVTSNKNGLIVADRANNTLTLLNGESGDIITRHQAERKGPFGVTTDNSGNVFVCYWDTREVASLSEDLKEERIFLSKKDGLGEKPQAIAYDPINHQLFISYFLCSKVDCFKFKLTS